MSDRVSSPSRGSQQLSDEDFLSASESAPLTRMVRELGYESSAHDSPTKSSSSDDNIPLAERRRRMKERQKEILKELAQKPSAAKKGKGAKKGSTSKKRKERETATVPPVVPPAPTVPVTVPVEEGPNPTGKEDVNSGEKEVVDEDVATTFVYATREADPSKSTGDQQMVVHTGETEGPSGQDVPINVPFEQEQQDGHETSITGDGEEEKEPSPKRQRHSEASSKKKGVRVGPLIKNPEPRSTEPKRKKKTKARVIKEVPSSKDAPKKGEKKKKVVEEVTPVPSLPTVRMTRGRSAKMASASGSKAPTKRSKKGKEKEVPVEITSESGEEEHSDKTVPTDVPPRRTTVTLKLPLFRSDYHSRFWKPICNRTLVEERPLNPVKVAGTEVFDILSALDLIGTVLFRRSFVKNIVLEFYCNLSKEVFDLESPGKFRTFVRGKYVDFSPQIIDEAVGRVHEVYPEDEVDLNEVAKVITAENLLHWPATGNIISGSLSVKYAILHKIAIKNWYPTSHRTSVGKDLATLLYRIGTRQPINFGQMVFNFIGEHAEAEKKNKALGFPGLIYSIITKQANLLEVGDVLEKPPEFLVISPKLWNEDKHIKDVEGVSRGKSKSYSKGGVLGGGPPKEAVLRAHSSRIIQELESTRNHLTASIDRDIKRRNAIDSLLFDLKHSEVPIAAEAEMMGEDMDDDDVNPAVEKDKEEENAEAEDSAGEDEADA